MYRPSALANEDNFSSNSHDELRKEFEDPAKIGTNWRQKAFLPLSVSEAPSWIDKPRQDLNAGYQLTELQNITE